MRQAGIMWSVKKRIGRYVKIEGQCVFRSLDGRPMKGVEIGDCTFIGEKTRVLIPSIKIGDYCKVHNHALFLGTESCKIGHNCWIGEYTVLNCHGQLEIGNNVAIGGNSHIWTHVRAGEMLQGSTLCSSDPVEIEDNVWLVGNGTTIYPGVTLAEGTVVMPNSVVTKSTQPWRCYAGSPAVDITSKLNPWKPISIDEKFVMMQEFTKEFIALVGGLGNPESGFRCKLGRIAFVGDLESYRTDGLHETLLITKNVRFHKRIPRRVSVFNVSTKLYTKRLGPLEIAFMRFLVPYRARFLPVEGER